MAFDIFDRHGAARDFDWLHRVYGNVQFHDAGPGPKFRLMRVDETEGPAVIKVRVLNPDGSPKQGQPVANHWPDGQGFTGFGIGPGSYIRDLAEGGPHTVWVLSPSVPSDGLSGIGMLGGTDHRGPLFLTFQFVEGEGVKPRARARALVRRPQIQARTRCRRLWPIS